MADVGRFCMSSMDEFNAALHTRSRGLGGDLPRGNGEGGG